MNYRYYVYTITLLSYLPPILLPEDSWSFGMPVETPPKHPTLLSLVSLNNASLVPFFTYSSSYPCAGMSIPSNPRLVCPKDLIPLLKCPVYMLKCPGISKSTVLL
jgi:hypothetical protein